MRRRLGVALLLDSPVAQEVDGLRRALGDPSLGRIAPHLTLVPPVNVKPTELTTALATLRAAAARQPGPLQLTLGSVATFLPANPVVYLAVGGELESLRRLRDDVFRPPLERSLSWPWVPHVTLADGIAEDGIPAALAAMSRYSAVTGVDRLVLLEEVPPRRWVPLADVALGPPARVGTGGLALELTSGRVSDPEAPGPGAPVGPTPASPLADPIVVTARRDGVPVGHARAWVDYEGAHVAVFVEEECRGQGIGTHLLARVETLARQAGWAFPELQAEGPCGFYQARSVWAVPTRTTRTTRTPPTRTSPAS